MDENRKHRFLKMSIRKSLLSPGCDFHIFGNFAFTGLTGAIAFSRSLGRVRIRTPEPSLYRSLGWMVILFKNSNSTTSWNLSPSSLPIPASMLLHHKLFPIWITKVWKFAAKCLKTLKSSSMKTSGFGSTL